MDKEKENKKEKDIAMIHAFVAASVGEKAHLVTKTMRISEEIRPVTSAISELCMLV